MGEGTGRQLLVMRHAEAETSAPSDAERALAERGRAAAAEVGRWLARTGRTPDHALVSAAARTRQTYEAVAGAAGWSLRPDLDRGLYAAGPDTALDLLRLIEPERRTVLMVGHNPTMAHLAAVLDDGGAEPDLLGESLLGFPTAALAVFSYDGEWADLAPGTARLCAFHVGDA